MLFLIQAGADTAARVAAATPGAPSIDWAMVAAIAAVASALANIAVVLVAHRGLKSIGLTQKDMLTRATRDARSCTIDRCLEMANEILPLRWEMLGDMATAKTPVFVSDAKNVTFGDANETAQAKAARKWMEGLSYELNAKVTRLVNKMEAWAMYFTHGLADQAIASGPCAHVFCSLVVQMYPIIVEARFSDRSGKFPNTVELFHSWYGKQQQEQLLQQVKDLQKTGRGKALPKPLGTDP